MRPTASPDGTAHPHEAALIASYYAAFFGAYGVVLPFFTPYLISLGLAPEQATRALALIPLSALVVPPLGGLIADAERARGWLLRGASTLMAVAFLGLFVARGRAIYAVTALYAFARAPLIALVDATALDVARRRGTSYGRLRLWGSLGFLVAAVGCGQVYERLGPAAPMLLGAGALATAAVLAWLLPAPPPAHAPEAVRAWKELVRTGDFWILLGAVALGQLAAAAYDGCYSLVILRLGYGGHFVGLAWAVAMVAEVTVLALSGRLFARVAPARLLPLALAAAVVRWLCLGHVTSRLGLLALQPLHGITFSLFYVSAVTLVRERGRLAPTAAQGLFTAACSVGSAIGMTLAGPLLSRRGAAGLFTCAAAVAAVACVTALAYARGRTRVSVAPCARSSR